MFGIFNDSSKSCLPNQRKQVSSKNNDYNIRPHFMSSGTLPITPTELRLDKLLKRINRALNGTRCFLCHVHSETDYLSFEGETWLVPFRRIHKHHVSDVGSDAGLPAAFKSDPYLVKDKQTKQITAHQSREQTLHKSAILAFSCLPVPNSSISALSSIV